MVRWVSSAESTDAFVLISRVLSSPDVPSTPHTRPAARLLQATVSLPEITIIKKLSVIIV